MPIVLEPEPYILWLSGAGFLVALLAWLPLALKRLPLSLPIICIALGAVIFSLPGVAVAPLPQAYPAVAERLSELVVIVALMGAGLKLDRLFAWRGWLVTWRLLGIAMPLTILAVTLLGTAWLGLPLASALLLAACLAPTDPVLAADVQVGPPRSGEEDEVRFGLTSEAGFNDALAFPFVNLALALALAERTGGAWLADWFWIDIVWKLAAGAGAGWLVGRLFGWLTFRSDPDTRLSRTGDGLIAIAATLLAYGATEMAGGYGFLAVFVAALTLRRADHDHSFNRKMHDFTEQMERLGMMVVLILFGGAIADGLLAPLGLRDYIAAAAIIFLIRPVAGWLGLVGFRAARSERFALAFFGIRGVGSIYYLAFALGETDFAAADRLWALAGLVLLLSILLHGLTVTPAMRALDRSQGRDPDPAAPAPDAVTNARDAAAPASDAAAPPCNPAARAMRRSEDRSGGR
ncbi:cation:proton antiporter [Sphingopyxis terrae]|uniref:Sodium/proton antiporter, CPA1 family n=1 Tax=Sphingopyxis terrae subsp. ummariensis TaxID=429001 RepID=A0A1Y6FP33_9SPHN|nr:cation:proton antiporter [Sphingopyxis terrae]PCF91316.1 cation transporter [Sphingopyxis terrae subsp. ummariensis]SMQ76487.1 sodium/proton antiporter, CPA1 family [Sphingopyxis terrae subsp. ummariensis]